ncbi:hypothetical protein [Streptomyces ossamyceticus]|uniref:hypothetical protein n=1 Tax=Streptomyces ossamyceticus TaxID=249581 RepID=UPI0034155DBC
MSDQPEPCPRHQLAEAADALFSIGRACIVVQPTLDVPYTDDPRWSPWTRWVQRPARTAYNLGALLRRQLGISRRPLPQWQSNAATRLYDAARQLSDQTIGHTETCEWHTNGHAYCSCLAYGAACAGVDAVLQALAEMDESEPVPPAVVHPDTSPQVSASARVDDSGVGGACSDHAAAVNRAAAPPAPE